MSPRRARASAFVLLVALAGACECGGPSVVDAGGGPGALDGGGAPGADGGAVDEDGCGLYERRCGDACVFVATDPDDCGACGVRCEGDLACSGGTCSATCPGDAVVCDNECVDTDVDSRHCGGCGQPCPDGEGCSAGACVPVLDVGPGPATCPPSGPPVLLPGGGATCAGDLAQVTFRWGLCSCGDVGLSARIVVDAYQSAAGPYVPGGAGGGLGLNGRVGTSAPIDVSGSLWAASSDGIGTSEVVLVGHELRSGGRFATSDAARIGRDAYVDGDVFAPSFEVGGALHVPAGAVVQGATYGSLVEGPVLVPPPCDCADDQRVPVAEIVAARRPPNNDDDAIGLDPDAFVGAGAPQRLDLPCGAYYLSSIQTSQPVTIVAHGRVALYVDGDVSASAPLALTLVPGAELDVFVAGRLGTSQQVKLGSPAYPALTRVYVGSPDGVGLSADLDVGAFLSVAEGPVGTSGDVHVYGGVLAGSFQSSGETFVHYDGSVLRAGESCEAPPGDGGVVAPDAGAPAGLPCESCRDCGNQACVDGACGACATSSDCCAPLLCVEGRCLLLPG